MNVTNCEQYVLAKLECERRRNERLVAENDKLSKQLDAMTKRANGYRRIINRPKKPIEELADEVMRDEMLVRFSYAHVTDVKDLRSGKLLGFDKWCHEVARLILLPDGISEEELIRFMRRDLKKVYDEKVAECTEQRRSCSSRATGAGRRADASTTSARGASRSAWSSSAQTPWPRRAARRPSTASAPSREAAHENGAAHHLRHMREGHHR